MSDVKWIHLATDIFDDEKIKLIEAMPDADTLIVIWAKLLCLAGKVNANGYIFLAKDIPYSENDLAVLFNRPVNTIKLALTAFQRLHMITLEDSGVIFLPNWEKHQNIAGLDTIREHARLRQQKHRQLRLSRDVTLLSQNVTSLEGDIEGELDKNNNIINDETSEKSVVDELVELGKQSKKDPPEWQQWRKQIFAQLRERRAYPLTKGQIAGEAKQMRWFFQNGYCPDQIVKAYDLMKSEPFWATKSLTLMSVAKQIGEVLNNGGNGSHPANPTKTTPRAQPARYTRPEEYGAGTAD